MLRLAKAERVQLGSFFVFLLGGCVGWLELDQDNDIGDNCGDQTGESWQFNTEEAQCSEGAFLVDLQDQMLNLKLFTQATFIKQGSETQNMVLKIIKILSMIR